MEIARTILEQLGGRKFVTMTGAKDFLSLKSGGLQFKLPSRFANQGINFIRIRLTPNDLYEVEFGKVFRLNYTIIETHNDVYFDELQSLFTRVTGLDTHL